MLFSPDFLHQLSSLLPPSSLPLLEPGNLSKKAQNKAAKEKRKQVKAVYQRRRRRGRWGSSAGRALHLITLLWLLLDLPIPLSWGGSAGPVVLNVFAILCNRVTFFISTTAACLTGVGRDATWLKRTLSSCKILACEWCFYCDTPGSLGFYVATWPELWTSWTDTLDFPSPLFRQWIVSLHKLEVWFVVEAVMV